MNLDAEQLAAADYDGSAVVLAGPGAGKTSLITHRFARLVQRHGVNAVLALTFSAEAAREMRRRAAGLLNIAERRLRHSVRTFHSLALAILKAEGDRRVLNPPEAHKLFRHVTAGWNLEDKVACGQFMREMRHRMVPPEEAGTSRFADAYVQYDGLLRAHLLLDFDSLIYEAVHLLRSMRSIGDRWTHRYIHVMVDEAHDTGLDQYTLARWLASGHGNLYCVGDKSQCQPPGTQVWTYGGRGSGKGCPSIIVSKSIEDLCVGCDTVLSWTKHEQRVYKVGRKFTIARREYCGHLLCVSVNGRMTRVTPEHRFWVRFTQAARTAYVVYLMYREDLGFRVGWCKLLLKHGSGFHLGQRARIEKADKAWILSWSQSLRDASLTESLIAAKFGITTMMFETSTATRLYDREGIRFVFSRLPKHPGFSCLFAHGLDFALPLYDNREPVKHHGYFRTSASNLLPILMELPTPATNRSAPIDSITQQDYAGPVYSLDVEPDHSYIADGIPVCNSIYGWRGACTKLLEAEDGTTVFTLGRNYRSTQPIIEQFKRYADCDADSQRLVDSMCAKNGAVGTVELWESQTAATEAERIAGLATGESTAVLGRTRGVLAVVADAFLRTGKPFQWRGQNFWRSPEISGLLGFLRLAANPDDPLAMREALQAPCSASRYLRGKFAAAVLADPNACSAVMAVPIGTWKDYQSCSWDSFRSIVADLRSLIGKTVPGVLTRLAIDWCGFASNGDQEPDDFRSENLDTFTAIAGRFPNMADFLEHATMAQHDSNDGTVLSTIHAAKGLEWDTVFLSSVSEGILPHIKTTDREEERRLIYVGMSRARRHLSVSWWGCRSSLLL